MKTEISGGASMKGKFLMVILLCYCSLSFYSCKKIADQPDDGTGAGNVKDYLVLKEKKKVSSALPAVGSNKVKISVKDSLFTIKGQAYMGRVVVLHPKLTVKGFNIAYSDSKSDYYYDVPPESWEKNDSSTVVYLGLQVPDTDKETTFPYNTKIIIQPYDENQLPLGEFERTITVEDPADPQKKTLWDEDLVWKWTYTTFWGYQPSKVRQVYSPMFNSFIEDTGRGYYYASCCADNIHFRVGDRMGGYGYCDSMNQYYRKIWVRPANPTVGYIFLTLFQNGTFNHFSGSVNYIFEPALSSCSRAYVHTVRSTDYDKTGIYTFTQTGSQIGTNSGTINFTTQVSTPPFGPAPRSGTLIYTNHLLVIISGRESKAEDYYERTNIQPVYNIEEFIRDYWWGN